LDRVRGKQYPNRLVSDKGELSNPATNETAVERMIQRFRKGNITSLIEGKPKEGKL